MKILKNYEHAKKALDRTNIISLDTTHIKSNYAHIKDTVQSIIDDVIKYGDKAVKNYTKKYDGVTIKSLKVKPSEIKNAYKMLDINLVNSLKTAAKRIEHFHRISKDNIVFKFESENIGKLIRPLNKIGIYVPGGTAAYPSTVLMTAIPAKIAGVNQMVMVTPPSKNGAISPATLVAADIAGIKYIFKVGGAQAIAALAYGTETIPKVDKICGPGNIYVAMAKKMVYGNVDIDGIQGPTEIVVVADETAKPELCAADLIAQAEHDAMASPIFISTSNSLIDNVLREIKKQTQKMKRADTIIKAFHDNGLAILVNHVNDAIELVNLYAPEHVILMVRNAKKYLNKIRNAGCIFIGENSPVALGDYIAGPSHVLPTSGTARFSSALCVESFLKVMNYVSLTKTQQCELGPLAINIALNEGLEAHANAINLRLTQR